MSSARLLFHFFLFFFIFFFLSFCFPKPTSGKASARPQD